MRVLLSGFETSLKQEKKMKKFGIMGALFIGLGSGIALAKPIVKCEKRSGYRNLCISRLTIGQFKAYTHEFSYVRTEDAHGICQEGIFEQSEVLFRRHIDGFENDEVEVTLNRIPSKPFVTVDFLESNFSDTFTSEQCESIYL